MIALLDVNVLIALAWANHMHHAAAHSWMMQNRHRGWATCPTTQAGFVRVSCIHSAVQRVVAVRDAMNILERNISLDTHHFWPETTTLPAMVPALRARIMGPKQLSDAILLNLAVHNKGVLATFDKRIPDLLAPDSPLRNNIEILPGE
jgi:uncharacterized protein